MDSLLLASSTPSGIESFVPASYDIMWSAVAGVFVALAIAAIVSLIRARDMTGLVAVIWLLVIVFLPLLGAVAWFVVRGGRAGTLQQD